MEEFLLNQVGKRLQGYFQNEFDNFLGMFPPISILSGRLKRRKAERTRKAQLDVYEFLLLQEKSAKEWTGQEWTGEASQLLWIGSPRVANSWWEMDGLYQRRV